MSGSTLLGSVISEKPPTREERQQTETLKQWLHDHKCYESSEEAALREEVIRRLNDLFNEWVTACAKRENLIDALPYGPQALIYTFGSYRLGVHGPGADIDTLCVGPNFCKRDGDFFGTDPGCLQQMLYALPEVDKDDFTPVPEAYVPVIKMKFAGISIDLLYAQLATKNINPMTFDIKRLDVLRGVDEKTVRSLNGSRVTDTILKIVQDTQTDVEQFRLALRYLKIWGKKAGIYSNVHGFLGGVNWAILVAKICQLYPRALAARIVFKFFTIYTKWHWPTPVVLCETRDEALGLQVWDPRSNYIDGMHKMPVITPCYPAMNSTANVFETSLEIMQEQFAAAEEIAKANMRVANFDWEVLLPRDTFFHDYKNYICIELLAHNEKDLTNWHGHVNSRLRKFCETLQRTLELRHWPDEYRPKEGKRQDGSPQEMFFIGLKRKKKPQANQNQYVAANYSAPVNLTHVASDFTHQLYTRFARRTEGMEVQISNIKRASLPTWVFPDGVNPFAEPLLALPAPESTPNAEGEAASAEAAVKPEEAVEKPDQSLKRAAPAADAAPTAKRPKVEAGKEPEAAAKVLTDPATIKSEAMPSKPGPCQQPEAASSRVKSEQGAGPSGAQLPLKSEAGRPENDAVKAEPRSHPAACGAVKAEPDVEPDPGVVKSEPACGGGQLPVKSEAVNGVKPEAVKTEEGSREMGEEELERMRMAARAARFGMPDKKAGFEATVAQGEGTGKPEEIENGGARA